MRPLQLRSTLTRRNNAALRVLSWLGLAAAGALVTGALVIFALLIAGLAGGGALPPDAIAGAGIGWGVLAVLCTFLALVAGQAMDALRRAHLDALDLAEPLAARLPHPELFRTFVALLGARPPRLFA